jgi:hypothetical protein
MLFGEGLQWAGCILIHLLQQVHRFNTMDFTYFLAHMNSVKSSKGAVVGGLVRGSLYLLFLFCE